MRVLHLSDIHYSLGAKGARRGADGCGDNAHGAVAEVGDRPLSLPAAEFYPAMVDRLGDVLPAFEACLREGRGVSAKGRPGGRRPHFRGWQMAFGLFCLLLFTQNADRP